MSIFRVKRRQFPYFSGISSTGDTGATGDAEIADLINMLVFMVPDLNVEPFLTQHRITTAPQVQGIAVGAVRIEVDRPCFREVPGVQCRVRDDHNRLIRRNRDIREPQSAGEVQITVKVRVVEFQIPVIDVDALR